MAKIAYNACFGGFCLSDAAVAFINDRYAAHAAAKGHDTCQCVDAYTYSHESTRRSDPDLIAAIEALGANASGSSSDIKIRELPAGTRYRIDEYDGAERVVTIDEYDWRIA